MTEWLEIRRTLVTSTLSALLDIVRFMNPPAGVDGKASDALLKLGKFFTRWEESDDGRVAFRKGGRAGDVFYRDRWSHDKVVRSTHGVNCTGSCSWKIYVRDGIITWEATYLMMWAPTSRLPAPQTLTG
jgi:hypothetical protein